MRFQQSLPIVLVLAAAAVALVADTTLWAQARNVDLGERLFFREWPVREIDVIEGTAIDGDGLGPLFNARSCVACHKLAGAGGAGANEHNVDLLTLTTLPAPPDGTSEMFDMRQFRADPPHPVFARRASVVIHRFRAARGYDGLRARLLGNRQPVILGRATFLSPRLRLSSSRSSRRPEPPSNQVVALVHSQRNTPALFGAGLIDEIPISVLEKLAATQHEKHEHVSGRVAPRGGKFGWRGQSPSLRAFVAGACANELGLQSVETAQPGDPLRTKYRNDGVDVHPEEIDAMRDYIAGLEPVNPIVPEKGTRAHAAWKRGEGYFEHARCSACHVADVRHVDGLYSDLLLHDMGPGLSDPAALSTSRSSGYYGESARILVSDELKQEWRTPPLWGVRRSGPYLHDGRAATVEAAILAHGGEAEPSVRLYQRLRPVARRELREFVESL